MRERAVHNLIANAAKYGGEGVALIFRTYHQDICALIQRSQRTVPVTFRMSSSEITSVFSAMMRNTGAPSGKHFSHNAFRSLLA